MIKKLFIGLPIRSATALRIGDRWKTDPRLNLSRIVWTEPPNWHVTLYFLGATPEEQVPTLGQMIDKTFTEIQPFTTHLRGLGVFPENVKPRVLWIGLDHLQPLSVAYALLGELLQQNGFLFDPKPLKPHLTLARMKSLADRTALESLLREYQSFDFGTVDINCVTLFESITTNKGVKYVPLFEKWLLTGSSVPTVGSGSEGL